MRRPSQGGKHLLDEISGVVCECCTASSQTAQMKGMRAGTRRAAGSCQTGGKQVAIRGGCASRRGPALPP